MAANWHETLTDPAKLCWKCYDSKMEAPGRASMARRWLLRYRCQVLTQVHLRKTLHLTFGC